MSETEYSTSVTDQNLNSGDTLLGNIIQQTKLHVVLQRPKCYRIPVGSSVQTHPQLRVELDPNDQDIRKEVTTVLTTQQIRRNFPKFLEADRFKHSSSFYRLKRSIVCIQRMIERKRSDKQYNWRIQGGPPTAREFEEAEKLILKSIQYKHFTLKYISVRTFSTRTCFKIDHPPK
jgi:hypothetical protein